MESASGTHYFPHWDEWLHTIWCVRLNIYFFRNGNIKLMWWIVVTEWCRPRILRVSTSCYSTVIHFCPGNSHGTYSVFLSAFEASQKPCERIHLVLISPNPSTSLRLRETLRHCRQRVHFFPTFPYIQLHNIKRPVRKTSSRRWEESDPLPTTLTEPYNDNVMHRHL